MTLITLDIGNSEIKWGEFEGKELQVVRRFPTHPEHSQSPSQAFLIDIFTRELSQLDSLEGIIYCSVVPAVDALLKQALVELRLQGLARHDAIVQAPVVGAFPGKLNSPISLGAYPPEQLGADRWVNLCALRRLYPGQAFLVASFGTATTLDVLDHAGNYMGGVILPGLKTYAGILKAKTAQLPEVPLALPESPLGTNTLACLQSGIGLGYVALIEGLMARIRNQHPDIGWLTMATGGLAETFIELSQGDPFIQSQLFAFQDPTLTLKGLAFLFRDNAHLLN